MGQPRRRLAVSCFILLGLGSLPVTQAGELPPPIPPLPTAKVSDDQMTRLANQLDDPVYQVREAATRKLAQIGQRAVVPVANAAATGSLETSTRAIAILERLYLTGDDDTSEASETELERLTGSTNVSTAARATTVLDTNQIFRQKRALARIVTLGGIVEDGFGGTIDINDPTALGIRMEIPLLHLGPAWTGGDEGLQHVKRLKKLQRLRVIRGYGITEKGIEDVQKALPGLREVVWRGPALLGISPSPIAAGAGCVIASVRADTAAAKAGVQQNDLLVEFGGQPVKDFDSLIKMIGETRPEEKVKVVVQRNGKPITLEVIMQGWK